MGDMGDIGRAMTEARKERHAEWYRQNLADLHASFLEFTTPNGGESLLFRDAGKPKVDFYPSTGRWRVAGVKKTFSGGAKAFIEWYKKQKAQLGKGE